MNPYYREPSFPMSREEMNARLLDPRTTAAEAVELQRMDYAARIALDQKQKDRISQGQFRQWEDRAANQLVKELRVSVYGKEHPDRHVVRFPADWWQAVKERFAPAWFRDRWPVVFTEITVSLKEHYPDIEPVLPDQYPVMVFRKREVSADFYDW